LEYVVSNYNPVLERQPGEATLKETSDYIRYKESNANPVSKLKYGSRVHQDLKELMTDEILPLRKE